ncbi:MAG: sigma-70 family RNA polymerase sigma factor [Bacteroides sp.]|jgi:RNA polymerase sigma-70 factor (ECF subfamily)|nr:sigma-70 family RNA polymerase sigma factor [Bacteroides sp.]
MENNFIKSTQIIADSYCEYRNSIYRYIYYKISKEEEAKDLTQDVFLRLIDYKQMLRKDTVRFFIFTIARNLVNDYLRHYYKVQEVTSYLYDRTEKYTNNVESEIIAKDLLMLEKRKLSILPAQRHKIYAMSRFGNKTSSEIATSLNLSQRTVENHLFISRKEVREYIKKCI